MNNTNTKKLPSKNNKMTQCVVSCGIRTYCRTEVVRSDYKYTWELPTYVSQLIQLGKPKSKVKLQKNALYVRWGTVKRPSVE